MHIKFHAGIFHRKGTYTELNSSKHPVKIERVKGGFLLDNETWVPDNNIVFASPLSLEDFNNECVCKTTNPDREEKQDSNPVPSGQKPGRRKVSSPS